MPPARCALSVCVLAFERISPFHLSVPCVVFGESHPGVPAMQLEICAERPGLIPSSVGVGLQVQQGLQAMAAADVVIVPSWTDPELPASPLVLKALRAAHARGALVVGLCLGAFVLAQAGLLDGRQAATHWAHAADMARLHPEVQLMPDVLYVQDGQVLTSAGTAAALDCCLHLLRQRLGQAVANRVARRLVTAPHRQGGQLQFIEQALPSTGRHERLSGLLQSLQTRLHERHSVDACAAQVAMSRRTFTRQFQQHTGQALGDWLLHARLQQVQLLLESSDLGMDAIAVQTGLGSAASLRRHFQRRFAVSPSAWRQTFRGR